MNHKGRSRLHAKIEQKSWYQWAYAGFTTSIWAEADWFVRLGWACTVSIHNYLGYSSLLFVRYLCYLSLTTHRQPYPHPHRLPKEKSKNNLHPIELGSPLSKQVPGEVTSAVRSLSCGNCSVQMCTTP